MAGPARIPLALSLVFAACLAAVAAEKDYPDLPDSVPAPAVHPPPAGNIPPRHLGDPPVPEPRPAPADTADEPKHTPSLPDPRSGARASSLMPPAEILCRQRLRATGAVFRDRPAEMSDAGCALPYPIELERLASGVAVEPAALVNCATAEALSGFSHAQLQPQAKTILGSDLSGLDQASGYVCRPRNGTTKLSEHAFGNALDIAAFRLRDGRTVAVSPEAEAAEARFLAAVRAAACGPFRTVLGPGSDADHATHLHLDLAPRRGDGTVCQ